MKRFILTIVLLFLTFILLASPPVTTTQLGTNSTSGIVALFHCNELGWTENQADDVIDSSGNGHHGTPKDDANTTDTAKFGRAGNFDGSDYIIVANHADFNLGAGASFSLSAWARSTSIATRQYIFDKYVDVGNKRQYVLQINASKFYFSVGDATGENATTIAGATTLTAFQNKWMHVAVVFDNDANLVFIYLNGVSDQTPVAKADDCVTEDPHIRIGARQEVADRFFVGQLDEPCVYNRALSADEVHSIYYKQVEVYIN